MDQLTGEVLHIEHRRVPWSGPRKTRYCGNVPEQQKIPVEYVLLTSTNTKELPNDSISGSNAETKAVQVLVYGSSGCTAYLQMENLLNWETYDQCVFRQECELNQ